MELFFRNIDSHVPSSVGYSLLCRAVTLAKDGWLLGIQIVRLAQGAFILQPQVARPRATWGILRHMIDYPKGVEAFYVNGQFRNPLGVGGVKTWIPG